MLKVIIVNGYPRSGKDTLTEFADAQYNIKVHSTVDKIKHISKIMGWDGIKTPESRIMLSELKDFYTKHFDGSFKDIVIEILTNNNKDFLFIFSREPEEIKRVKDYCNDNSIYFRSILINREDSEKDHTSHSDSAVENFNYDIIINNNYNLSDFRFEVLKVLYRLS